MTTTSPVRSRLAAVGLTLAIALLGLAPATSAPDDPLESAEPSQTDEATPDEPVADETPDEPVPPADAVALWLAQPWSRGTREHYWSVLKAWWRWLVVTGRRETSPLVRLQKPRGPVYLPKPATREQIRRVLAGRLAPDTRAKILLGAYAGLRVSEMASFRGSTWTSRSGACGSSARARATTCCPSTASC